VPTDVLHSDGTATVTFGATARAGGASPAWDGATCTGSYCHGAFTGGTSTNAPQWTGTSQAPCGSCHATPPNDPIHPVRTDCGTCHPGYTLTQANLTLHVNGIVDVAGLGCSVCHGTSTRTPTTLNPQLPAAPPSGVHGETLATQRPVGAHQAHLVGDTLSTGVGCGECHVVPTNLSHRDGQVAIQFGTLAKQGTSPASWSAAAGTCAGSYCHGNTLQGGTGKTAGASWTATSVACDACHGLPPLTGALKNGVTLHQFHVVSKNKDCVTCHGTGYSAGATKSVAKATHIDGALKVGGAGSSVSSWNAATHSCTPTCHGRETW
jgi:predicted CxxxxCH...CXXCH cytochrome family protein